MRVNASPLADQSDDENELKTFILNEYSEMKHIFSPIDCNLLAKPCNDREM
jgi:hypothetical protein